MFALKGLLWKNQDCHRVELELLIILHLGGQG